MANAVIAYICWLIGGPVGLHHFYLGRDRQAFIWWATFGGFCGAGCFRDLWRIPDYVNQANEDVESYKDRVRRAITPPTSMARFAGSLAMSLLLAYITRAAIPEDYIASFKIIKCVSYIAPIFSAAIGAYVVNNIGDQKVRFRYALFGAAIPSIMQALSANNMAYMSVSAAFSSRYYREWKLKKDRKKHFCLRISKLFVYGLIYSSLWTSMIYLNSYVTTNDGQKVPMREAVNNFFKSRAWEETKETLGQLYDLYKMHGFKKLWEEFIDAIDASGETNAYKVLDINHDATHQEIKQKCRKLSRTWHPDKVKTQEEKDKAQEKFIEIQKACDILTKHKSRPERYAFTDE